MSPSPTTRNNNCLAGVNRSSLARDPSSVSLACISFSFIYPPRASARLSPFTLLSATRALRRRGSTIARARLLTVARVHILIRPSLRSQNCCIRALCSYRAVPGKCPIRAIHGETTPAVSDCRRETFENSVRRQNTPLVCPYLRALALTIPFCFSGGAVC